MDAASAAAAAPYVDALVKEYLLYRGCAGALHALQAELVRGRAPAAAF